MAGKKGMKHKKKRNPMDIKTRKKIAATVKKRWQEKEYREKVSEAHSHPISEEWKSNISSGMKGIKRSDETLERMRKAAKERILNNCNGRMTDDILTPSSIELIVKNQLELSGIRYIQQKRIYDGSRFYFLDFYLPEYNLVLECNGDYWHSLPERKERDRKLKEYVEQTGRRIIFVWEYEILDDWFWIGDYLK